MAEPHYGIVHSKVMLQEFSPRLQRGLTQVAATTPATRHSTLRFRNGVQGLLRCSLRLALTQIGRTSTGMDHCGPPSIGRVGVTAQTQISRSSDSFCAVALTQTIGIVSERVRETLRKTAAMMQCGICLGDTMLLPNYARSFWGWVGNFHHWTSRP